MIRKFGWKKPTIDSRDYQLMDLYLNDIVLPQKVDLKLNCPPVYDQGNLGSCTANAAAGAYDIERKKQSEEFITPSRLFIYYNERVLDGIISEDNGAENRDGIKVLANIGVCPELEWPYIEEKFAEKPSDQCYIDAIKFKSLTYYSLDPTDINSLETVLANGYAFIVGMECYRSILSDDCAQTGIMEMPGFFEHSQGGHAVVCVGYNQTNQTFLIRNSWGSKWGQDGYFTMPYEFMVKYCDDLWVLKGVV